MAEQGMRAGGQAEQLRQRLDSFRVQLQTALQYNAEAQDDRLPPSELIMNAALSENLRHQAAQQVMAILPQDTVYIHTLRSLCGMNH